MVSRAASGRRIGATHEIELATDRADRNAIQRLGIDAAVEPDLKRRVDRNHPVDPGQNPLAVRVGRRPHRNHLVLVHEAIEPLRADHLVGDGDPGIDPLLRIRDRAALDQVDNGVVDQAGMNAEIARMRRRGQDRVGDTADAELQRAAIGDQARCMGGDPPGRGSRPAGSWARCP